MKTRKFFAKGLLAVQTILKFAVLGIVIMSVTVVLKNRTDLLQFGISVIVSFILGGIAMALSLAKEFKNLIRENNSLNRKLKKAQTELDEFNENLDNVSVGSLIDFNEAKNKSA